MKILDCTLRDGGYYTNWDFDDKIVDAYIRAMNLLPIDYLELGYRNLPSVVIRQFLSLRRFVNIARRNWM